VSFINVGQGDAILIREGYHALMIDTGGNLSFDMAKEVDIPFLRKNHINHLDYLIASHGISIISGRHLRFVPTSKWIIISIPPRVSRFLLVQ
jgi:hypothetical protein